MKDVPINPDATTRHPEVAVSQPDVTPNRLHHEGASHHIPDVLTHNLEGQTRSKSPEPSPSIDKYVAVA